MVLTLVVKCINQSCIYSMRLNCQNGVGLFACKVCTRHRSPTAITFVSLKKSLHMAKTKAKSEQQRSLQ